MRAGRGEIGADNCGEGKFFCEPAVMRGLTWPEAGALETRSVVSSTAVVKPEAVWLKGNVATCSALVATMGYGPNYTPSYGIGFTAEPDSCIFLTGMCR